MSAGCKAKIGKFLFILSSFIFAQNVWAAYEGQLVEKRNDSWRITQYLDPLSDSKLVMLSAGQNNGIMDGLVLNSYRRAGEQKIETGLLKVTHVNAKFAIAEVLSEGTPFSIAAYSKFPGVMAGDFVEQQKLTLAKKKIVVPNFTIGYYKIFQDPKQTPTTYEISEKGKEEIRNAVRPFLNAHLPMLMVEGHTDHNGTSTDNQIESYQRALTIRQFLIEDMQIDENKIIAVGFGESETVDDSLVAGYRNNNRRIVIKPVSTI